MWSHTHTSLTSLLFASLTARTAFAVSLADFTPRVSDLPSSCETLYTAQIASCQGSDFQSSKCSSSCITALNALTQPVIKACGGQGVTGENIIVAFLADQGTESLCPNYSGESSSGSAATSKASGSSAVASSATASATGAQSTVAIGSSTMVVSSASVSTSGSLVDTSSIPSSTTSSSTAASTTSSSASLTTSSAPTTTLLTTAPPSSSSVAVTDSLAVDTSTPASVASAMHSSTSTVSAVSAQETSGGEGSPFDSYTGGGERTAGTSAPFALIPAFLLVVLAAR